MEPKSPSKLKCSDVDSARPRYTSALNFLVSVIVVELLVFGFYLVFKHVVQGGLYYTVVVDCGSTGTRVNVYEWILRGVGREDLPVLVKSYPDDTHKSLLSKSSCQYHCLQTEPGLDKFLGNALGVRASLEPLILWAESLVPVEKRKVTPIFVLGTAGLRRLRDEDSRCILDGVEAVVREYPFVYRRNWIRALSGKEEAYYGWLALNYKMGNLGNSSRMSTLGLLDLGGSSLQVVVKDDEMEDNEFVIKSEIGLSEYRILAYSLPAFGLNEAFDRTVAILSQMPGSTESTVNRIEIKHPCLSSAFMQNYTCYNCAGRNFDNPKGDGSQMLETASTSTLVVGDPNWEHCKSLARAVAINSSNFDWSQPAVRGNCKGSLSSLKSKFNLLVLALWLFVSFGAFLNLSFIYNFHF